MTNTAKHYSQQDGAKFLQDSFANVQKLLKTQLELSKTSITHNGVMGEVNEQHFISILRDYLPDRYAIDNGIIIDSQGKTSDQIDIIIFDNQYTPTLLAQANKHRFVPAEAVYAVFEVKPEINSQYLNYAGNKAESVRNLHRTSVPIPHAGGEYPPKPLHDIVSGIIAIDISWSDKLGKNFRKNYKKLEGNKKLDCGFAVSGYCFDQFDSSLKIENKEEQTLIFFIFRLLGKLQSLGTVPAIDWNAYAQKLSS